MTMLGRLAAFGSAAAGTAALGTAAWIAVGHGGPAAPPRSPSPTPTRVTASADIVCVGADGILRAAAGLTCSAGQTQLPLVRQDSPTAVCDSCDPFDRQTAPSQDAPAQDDPVLDDIARRIDALKRSAVFEVVDNAGVVIFSVARDHVRMFTTSRKLIADMSVSDHGGYFKALSADRSLVATIGASGSQAGLLLHDNNVERASLELREAGNTSLIFPSVITGPIAALGESRAGGGALVIGDRLGHRLVSAAVIDGKGTIGVVSSGGAPLLSLGQGESGSGLFVIGDSASEPMVKMGVKDDRYGAVLTGPKAGFPYVPRSGLPGSYFFGCAGCLP